MKKKLLIWMLAGCMAAAMPATVLAAENVEESGTETEAGTAELGDDIYSFQVMFDGDLLKLPMSCDELISMGWQAENPEDLDTMVQTNSYITGVRFVKGNYYISADILNLGINEEPASKCLIGGIEVDASGAVHENIGQKIEPGIAMLPGNIEVGTATIEDIKAAYGEPTDTHEDEVYTVLTYDKDSFQDITLTVYQETGTLLEVDMQNFVEPEDFDPGTVSGETPSIVSDYKEPSALGDDLMDPTVEFMGDLYQLPAPVSAFEANGWVIQDAEEGAYAEGGGLEFIDMMKENQTVRFSVYNFTENAVALSDCFVQELSFATYDPEIIDMKLGGGVTLGVSKDDLKTMAEAKGYVYEEEGDYVNIYKNENSGLDDYLSFWFNSDEDPDKASGITVHHEVLKNS
ncbi:hypothetical protein [Merdimonas faecis]|uniref:hypothetical protein n=1 Tax=Merdimonas faecis TaxID=1653435 RepID=UPI0023F7F4BC|nr:hypothetical protein [Merdimonas faecis]